MPPRQPADLPAGHANAWPRLAAREAGFDGKRLDAAVAFAEASESPWPRSFYYPDGRYVGIVEWNEKGPWSEIAGPVVPRGGASGLVLAGGHLAASWGDVERADMTFSVAKSFLAILAGIAVDDRLIPDVEAPVAESIPGPLFASERNRRITWRHLLQQSSEWQGELFGKADQVDHYRQVGAGGDNSRKGDPRPLQPPGSHYEYNDVRVNVLALALLHRFRKPLPEVLAERIMKPIGASGDWRWNGYHNSFVEIDGRRIQSVSGGAHWGGGMLISAADLARVGLLIAAGGQWGGRQLISQAWIRAMLAPSPTYQSYGYMWWLNQGDARYPAASPDSVFMMGAGTNLVWIEPRHDLVTVLRWIDKTRIGSFVERLIAARADARGSPAGGSPA